MVTEPDLPETARPSFTRQAQLGRRVIFRWEPSAAERANPLTQPWPALDALIEGIEFADEEAARRFDLDRGAERARAGGRRARRTAARRVLHLGGGRGLAAGGAEERKR
jgi:hypothetical protein